MVKREIKLRREVSFVQPTRSFFTLYEGYRKSMKHELNMTYGIMVIKGSTWELPQTANYNLKKILRFGSICDPSFTNVFLHTFYIYALLFCAPHFSSQKLI